MTIPFKLNTQHCIDCREGLDQLPNESIDCIITSPPYYNLRDYDGDPTIWDGDPECEHEWSYFSKHHDNFRFRDPNNIALVGNNRNEKIYTNPKVKHGFCSKCRAWKGKLGNEPSMELYITHLCDIFEKAKPKLTKYGSLWVNLGASYGSHKGYASKYNRGPIENKKPIKGFEKSLLLIPFRFALEMVNRGFIIRNVIIWEKPNYLPSSSKDRFTVDFEYLFWFVKNTGNPLYYVNTKTLQSVRKKPKGIHGTEDIDWEWVECSRCDGSGIKHKECLRCEGIGWYYTDRLQAKQCSECHGIGHIKLEGVCKSCNGTGQKKKSYWKSRDYYFEQQFEKSTTEFIYSRSSKKGKTQETNNPRKNWGFTKKELEHIKGYESKYKHHDYGQGFIRNQSIKKERDLSRVHAKELFPHDKKKQQQYINYVHDHGFTTELGRNKRCVWKIPTKPNSREHFAVFNSDLIETPIKACCPEYVCKMCGLPREKVMKIKGKTVGASYRPNEKYEQGRPQRGKYKNDYYIGGYTDCGCNAGYRHGIVLDPFSGIGTTIETAFQLGRDGLGFDSSKKYCTMANEDLKKKCGFKRITDFIYTTQKEKEVIN